MPATKTAGASARRLQKKIKPEQVRQAAAIAEIEEILNNKENSEFEHNPVKDMLAAEAKSAAGHDTAKVTDAGSREKPAAAESKKSVKLVIATAREGRKNSPYLVDLKKLAAINLPEQKVTDFFRERAAHSLSAKGLGFTATARKTQKMWKKLARQPYLLEVLQQLIR